MGAWIRFFIGTPKRFLASLVGAGFVFGLFRPDLIQQAVYDLFQAVLTAITPFIEPLLTLGIVFIGLGIILRVLFGGKKKK